MQVTVKDGVAIKIVGNAEHPTTAGTLCTKVARYLERTYHAERILHPLKRIGKKGAGRFERISWEQALNEISARLKTIAAEDPEQIVPYSYAGTMGLIQGESMSARFFHRLGAARLARTICAEAGSLAMRYTVGGSFGMDVEQFAHSKLIIFWGCNAVGSNLHLWALAQEAKRNGARLIAIDPYRSLTAEKCHQHIAPMPGTDAALALGMMHVLITENLLDHDYIKQYTLGFDALRERALQYPPEKAAALTEAVGALDNAVEDSDGTHTLALSCTTWLSHNLHISNSSAAAQVHLARRLPSLPATSSAFADGELSALHVSVVSRIVEQVERAEGDRELAETLMLQEAEHGDPRALLRWGFGLVHRLAPDEREAEEERRHRRRYLHLSEVFDGCYEIEAYLDPECGATLKTALNGILGPRAKGDERSPGQRRADGLGELARRGLDSGEVPGRGGQKPPGGPSCSMKASMRRIKISGTRPSTRACAATDPTVIFGATRIRPMGARGILDTPARILRARSARRTTTGPGDAASV